MICADRIGLRAVLFSQFSLENLGKLTGQLADIVIAEVRIQHFVKIQMLF